MKLYGVTKSEVGLDVIVPLTAFELPYFDVMDDVEFYKDDKRETKIKGMIGSVAVFKFVTAEMQIGYNIVYRICDDTGKEHKVDEELIIELVDNETGR